MTEIADILKGRCLFIPRMGSSSTRAFVAAFQSEGIEAAAVPPSDQRTLELSGEHISGDECYPVRVVLGDFLRAIESHGPDRVALFMPTTCGPCRFGQYSHYIKKVLQKLEYTSVPILSPSSSNGYDGLAVGSNGFLRTSWRAIIVTDLLQRMLLSVRPYERNSGETEEVYNNCLDELCRILARPGLHQRIQLEMLTTALKRSRDLLKSVPVIKKRLPLIGIVGEIFCRLNEFSNQNMIHRIESCGAECWLSGVTEWIAYSNHRQMQDLGIAGKRFSPDMFKARIKDWVLHRDEHKLVEPFRNDLREEADLADVLKRSLSYLPPQGAIGEMVLNVGKVIYLWEKGASGIIDISPFSCMNGIVCQAVYPRVSDDHDGIPIRVFFFDQTRKDMDQDIAIFMDLVRTYRNRKNFP